MATLIQSKQIEGVVSASVIQGDFQVDSGSVNLTGATGVSGSFSGSFIGDGSGLSNIPYSNITGTPIFKGGSNTTIASSSNIITISSTGGGGGSTDISHLNTFTASYYTDSSSFDSRITGISASGSGADWDVNLQNIPSGLVSGSVLRTLDGTGVLSGSITNYLPSGTVSGSSQITFSGLSGKPSGLVSSSAQITDGSGILSGSIVDQLPSGIISGSTFTSFSSSVDSRLDTLENATDNTGSDTQTLSISGDQLTISDGNTVTIPTGSGTVPAGTISGSAQITAFGFTSGSHTDIPSGTVSGSSQLTSSYDSRYLQTSTYTTDSASFDTRISNIGDHANISHLNAFTQSAGARLDSIETFTSSIDTTIKTKLNTEDVLSGSIESLLPSGVISGSTQITDGSGIFSGSLVAGTNITINQSGNDFIISSSASGDSIPAGTISGSAQITALGFTSGSHTDISHLATTGSNTFKGDTQLFQGTATTALQIGDTYQGGTVFYVSDSLSLIAQTSDLSSGITLGDTGVTGLSGSEALGDGVENTNNIATNYPGSSTPSKLAYNSTGSGYTDWYLPNGLELQTFVSNVGGITGNYATSEKDTVNNGGSLVDYFVIINGATGGKQTYAGGIENKFQSVKVRAIRKINNGVRPSNLSSTSVTISGSLDVRDGITGSIDYSNLTNVPSGVVSGSTQITDGSGIVSGSVIRTFDGTGIFSGSLVAGSNITINQVGNNFEISSSASGGSASVTVSDSAPGSPSEGDLWWKSNDGNLYIYYDGYWVISTDITTGLPAGVVSGSAQITSVITDTYISASAASSGFGSGGGTSDFTQLTNVPSGLVSGSSQLTSSYDTRYLNVNGDGVVSGSVLRTLDGTGVVSGSVLRTLDGTGVVSGSVLRTLDGTNVFSGSFIGQGGTTITSGSGNVIISSSASGDVTFNGNRIISQQKLPAFFTSSFNPGTSGSVQDFLNAIFYPNSEPSITTGNQTISEYSASNAQIVQLVATDPEGQSLTFGTASSYTDDLVRVSSGGIMTLNALAESSSFNTDSVSGGHGHLVKVTATDTFNSTVEKDIYIIVTPNEAPVFRETSISGNVITSVTSNLNESSANDTLVKRVFFTDTESDTITITTSSIDNNHFDIDIQSTYLDIRQNTGSLDYEQQTSYSFSITASDEHFEAGQDSDSFTILPITVNVTDNLVPVVNSQVVGSINENSSNGASVGSISATDNEGDSISFVTFDLHKLLLDGVEVSSGSYGGTSQLTDPHENPFQMDSSGNVTRKTGVYLNSDLINQYQYRVQVRDNYNATISSASVASINVADDTPATLTDNFDNLFIKESELSGTTIKTTNYGSTAGDFNSNQSGTFSSSNSQISINGSGTLSLGFNISGSVTQSGDTIDSTITFTNTFGTTTNQSISVSVIENHFPSASFTNQTSNFNSNLATTNTNMVLVSITDTEGDTPYSASLSGTDAGKLNINYTNSNSSSLYIRANENLSAGTITYNLKVTDAYSKSSNYTGRTITIAAADTGTLEGDTTSYIIESAESGDTIRDTSGFGAGSASQLSVSYDPSYGSPVVQSYTSSNAAISVDTSGNLTLGVDISGSATQSGEIISSTITFRDQYDNVGSGTVNVNVFANHFPSASFTQNTSIYNENQMVSGSLVESFTITDTETDVPYSISLSGTDASKIDIVPQNSNTSSVQLKTKQDLVGGSYTYIVDVSDSYSKTSQYDRTVTIASADTGSITTNGTFYIIESALNGDFIFTNGNGRTGTQGDLGVSYSPNYGSQVVQSFTSSNALIDIDSNGNLSAGGNISGSGNTDGDTITSTITYRDQYDNIGSGSITVNVAQNNAPTVSSTSTSNLNTNQATGSAQVLNLLLSDTESDAIPNGGLSFSGFNSTYFTPSISTPNMRLLVNNTSVPAGTYAYTASIQDTHGFSITTVNNTFTIAQASTGSLGGDTAIYIIESAESGSVFRDQTGFNQGNAAQLSVSYSPNYGSAVVQSYTSSREGISVDSSGNLTAGYDFSGSVTSTDYTSTALVSDSTNSTLYDKSLHVNGIKVVQGAATGSQSAVPDAFTEKVAQTIKLMVTSSGADINDTDQANMIGILKGETGTWHSGYPTAQRILRGAGSDYSPNPLIDSNYSSYPGLQNFQDSHATDDMIWYLNSSAASGSGDADIVEVIEHLMHTIHQYGVRGAVSGSYNELSWDPDTDSDWNTRELYFAIKEAVDDSVFDISDYGDASYNTASTFKLIAKEYLYLLNFNMWEYSSLWSGGSLSPEWNDNSRTPSGIQTNNPLGYALYNKYIKPVLTKPSKTVLQNIFQDGDVGNPTVAGSSGYTPEVGTGLISEITFRDQYDNIGSGVVTATVFGNSSPVASFTQTSGYESDNATSGSDAGALVITDTESNSPFSITLAGTDGGKFDVSGTSSPFEIQPTGSLAAGTYTINITVTDNYGESVTLTGETITVDASANNGKVYVYDVGFNNATYNTALGIQSEDSSTPPVATPYSGIGFIEKIINGDVLGDSSFTYSYGGTNTSNRLAEGTGDNVHDVLRAMGSSGTITRSTSVHFAILIPSGSSMSGIPTSTNDSYGGSTAGEYVLEVGTDGTTIDGSNTLESSEINQITLSTAHLGFTKWFVVGATNQISSTSNFNLGLNPSSGSGGA